MGVFDISHVSEIKFEVEEGLRIVSGAVAGACQVIVSSPLDVVKVRMQTRRQDGDDTSSSTTSQNGVVDIIGWERFHYTKTLEKTS